MPQAERMSDNVKMKICDLTQFYSPLSGGVKRYVNEKMAYINNHTPWDEHVLVVPGEKTESRINGRSRIYSVHSPLLSRTSRYRALLNLRAIEEILERERPDLLILVMSATLDAAALETYLRPCAVIRSEGRTFPVDVEYLDRRVGMFTSTREVISEGMSRGTFDRRYPRKDSRSLSP